MSKDLPAIQLSYDLAKEMLTRVAKFPRDHKFTLGDRIAERVLDVLESLLGAAYSKDKIAWLEKAHRRLEEVRMLLRLSRELGPLSNQGYEHVMVMVTELGKQVVGWRKQAEKRLGQNVQEPV